MNIKFLLLSIILLFSCAYGHEVQHEEHGQYYSKKVDYDGIIVRAHKAVDNAAFKAVNERLERLLKHLPQVRQKLVERRAEVHIVHEKHSIYHTPRFKTLGKPSANPNHERLRAVSSLNSYCSEEGLLLKETYRFAADKRDVALHEICHAIMDFGIPASTRHLIIQQYEKTKKKNLWPGCYAISNAAEFFAEISMWYFGTNGDPGQIKPAPKAGPEWLKGYDPATFAFLDDFWQGRLPMNYKPTDLLQVNVKALAHNEKVSSKVLPKYEGSQLIFRNKSGRKLKFFWVDYEGQKQYPLEVHETMHFGLNVVVDNAYLIIDGDKQYYFRARPNITEVIYK